MTVASATRRPSANHSSVFAIINESSALIGILSMSRGWRWALAGFSADTGNLAILARRRAGKRLQRVCNAPLPTRTAAKNWRKGGIQTHGRITAQLSRRRAFAGLTFGLFEWTALTVSGRDSDAWDAARPSHIGSSL